MRSVTAGHIYTGPWVDWSQGVLLGSTITLSSKTAPIFTAFLAFFVTIVGACLWRVICFLFHQLSASERPQDGQHHQHQLIFRNTASPTAAMRAFFESAFFWRKSGRRPFSRALPLALFAVVFTLALAAGSVLSSKVTNSSGSQRLIIGNCGYFGYNENATLPIRTKAMVSKDLNDTIIASAYARQCYAGNDKLNKMQCSMYEQPALSYKVVADAPCPFEKSMCKDNLVYQLDTGLIDTHTDLGINMPTSGRIGFRKVSTCAPITQDGYRSTTTTDGTDGLGLADDKVLELHYGGIASISALSNTTYYYNTHAFVDGWGYELESITASPNATAGWLPIPELARKDADISLIFLAPNAIKFYELNTDPMFSATIAADAGSTSQVDASYFLSDEFVNVMACTDQYQYCHPQNPSKCTPLTDYATAWLSIYSPELHLNKIQQAVASRIALQSRTLSIHHGISGRGASALRAQEYVSDRSQLEIKPNQWQLEVNSWFDVGLAKLQRGIVQYATGPEYLPEGTYLQRNETDVVGLAMCGSQKVRIEDGTTSFSVLGVGIIFGVGGVVVLIYLVLETVISFLQRKLKWGDYRRVRWVMDDKLQVQRMAFEGAGMGGEWQNLNGMVPVTSCNETFAGLEHVDPEKPRWKARDSYLQRMGPVYVKQGDEEASVSSLQQQDERVKFETAVYHQQQQRSGTYEHVPRVSPRMEHVQMGHGALYEAPQHTKQQWPLNQPQQTTAQQVQQPAAYERQSYQPVPSQSL